MKEKRFITFDKKPNGVMTINADKVIRFEHIEGGGVAIYVQDGIGPIIVKEDFELVYQMITGKVYLK